MATLTQQRVRAEVSFGTYTVRTPDVISFSVNKRRGQPISTFSASVKVSYTFVETGEVLHKKIVIKAGTPTANNTVFTGWIHEIVVSPIRSDASKVMLSISGKDILSVLEGQKITRRTKTYMDGSRPIERWGVVNNVVRQNTPARQRFKNKIYTKNKLAIKGLLGTYAVDTPPAFKPFNLTKEAGIKTFGVMSAEKINMSASAGTGGQ